MANIQESPDGYKWYVGGPETDDHLALGGHEPALYPILRSMMDRNKGYINVGAHIGTWAIRMAKYARYVIAFEANPLTATALENNIQLNGITNIRVIAQAVWDTNDDFVTLVDVNNKPTGGSTRAEQWGDPFSELRSKTITLDNAFQNVYDSVGLISMDVEGAEAKVLAGAEKLITTARPNMLIELHDGHPGTDHDLREQVYALLHRYNYTFTSINVAPPEEHLLCYPAENVLTLDVKHPD